MDAAERFLRQRGSGDRTAVSRVTEALPGQAATIGVSPVDRRGPLFGVSPDEERARALSRQLRHGGSRG